VRKGLYCFRIFASQEKKAWDAKIGTQPLEKLDLNEFKGKTTTILKRGLKGIGKLPKL
jgi:hypothetical protein